MLLVYRIRDRLTNLLLERFKLDQPELLTKKSFVLASALDPRFKDLKFFEDEKLKDKVWETAKLLTNKHLFDLKKKDEDKLMNSSSTTSSAESSFTSSSQVSTKPKTTLRSLLGDFCNTEDNISGTSKVVDDEMSLEDEVGRI